MLVYFSSSSEFDNRIYYPTSSCWLIVMWPGLTSVSQVVFHVSTKRREEEFMFSLRPFTYRKHRTLLSQLLGVHLLFWVVGSDL